MVQRLYVRRGTAFQICFAFGPGGNETDDFFRRIYVRERGFNCHQTTKAVYYNCLNNGFPWAKAAEILSRIRPAGKIDGSGIVVYTGALMEELNPGVPSWKMEIR